MAAANANAADRNEPERARKPPIKSKERLTPDVSATMDGARISGQDTTDARPRPTFAIRRESTRRPSCRAAPFRCYSRTWRREVNKCCVHRDAKDSGAARRCIRIANFRRHQRPNELTSTRCQATGGRHVHGDDRHKYPGKATASVPSNSRKPQASWIRRVGTHRNRQPCAETRSVPSKSSLRIDTSA